VTLHSNSRGADHIENAVLLLLRIHWNVFIEPLPRNDSGVHVTILTWYMYAHIHGKCIFISRGNTVSHADAVFVSHIS
jgi:hypothetical protein